VVAWTIRDFSEAVRHWPASGPHRVVEPICGPLTTKVDSCLLRSAILSADAGGRAEISSRSSVSRFLVSAHISRASGRPARHWHRAAGCWCSGGRKVFFAEAIIRPIPAQKGSRESRREADGFLGTSSSRSAGRVFSGPCRGCGRPDRGKGSQKRGGSNSWRLITLSWSRRQRHGGIGISGHAGFGLPATICCGA